MRAAARSSTAPGPRGPATLANLGRLLRFTLRRDRWGILAWSLGIALSTVAVPLSYVGLYPTEAQRGLLAQTLSSPVYSAVSGSIGSSPITGCSQYSSYRSGPTGITKTSIG